MNPFIHATVRDSSPAEVEALHKICEQLAGFNPNIHLEWVDGFLTSLAAGPQLPVPEVWLPALCGDAFDRAFADPADRLQAQRALHTRLKVLCEQLNPEKLLDAGDALRLSPLMMEWTDADREELVQDGKLAAEDLPVVVTGAEWALGFIDGTEAFGEAWLGPLDEEPHAAREGLLDQLVLLFMPRDEPERAEMLAKYYPAGAEREPGAAADSKAEGSPAADTPGADTPAADEPAADEPATDEPATDKAAAEKSAAEPSHEDLITGALFAAQDLRLFWLDNAPKLAPRRVAAEPGRNDPCHCGSGRKFKKCHGAVP